MRDRLDSLLDDIAGHELLEDIPRPALAGGAILAVLLVLFAAIVGVNSVSSVLNNSDEFEPLPTGPSPSMPEAARVVDDIETLADFGYRKIDTVAHSNAGDFIQFRFEDLGYEVEIQICYQFLFHLTGTSHLKKFRISKECQYLVVLK